MCRELAQKRDSHLVWCRLASNEFPELAAGELRDVEQRSERPRREQRVTRSPEDSRRARLLVTKAPQERGLADTGLPADEHEATVPLLTHRPEPRAERRKLALALEQLGRTLGCA